MGSSGPETRLGPALPIGPLVGPRCFSFVNSQISRHVVLRSWPITLAAGRKLTFLTMVKDVGTNIVPKGQNTERVPAQRKGLAAESVANFNKWQE